MRLFAAVFPTEEVLHQLEAVQRELMKLVAAPCSWTKRDRMHLTLRFFGDDADPSHAEQTVESVVATARAGELVMDHCSGFPNPKRARVLFAGTATPDERVLHLSRALNPEERNPIPHLTLGRPRQAIQVPSVRFEPILFEVRELVLVHSILGGPQAGYHILKTWVLPR